MLQPIMFISREHFRLRNIIGCNIYIGLPQVAGHDWFDLGLPRAVALDLGEQLD